MVVVYSCVCLNALAQKFFVFFSLNSFLFLHYSFIFLGFFLLEKWRKKKDEKINSTAIYDIYDVVI